MKTIIKTVEELMDSGLPGYAACREACAQTYPEYYDRSDWDFPFLTQPNVAYIRQARTAPGTFAERI